MGASQKGVGCPRADRRVNGMAVSALIVARNWNTGDRGITEVLEAQRWEHLHSAKNAAVWKAPPGPRHLVKAVLAAGTDSACVLLAAFAHCIGWRCWNNEHSA
jgi:hypothetical protein